MGEVCWDFPLLGTGSLRGSNNAAITMFKGTEDMDGLVREICQNSLDARDTDVPADKPVRVKFRLFELEKKNFSMFAEFGRFVQGARDYWNNNSPVKDRKTLEFLDMVSKYLEMERIPVLIVSDYNTIGLNGVNPVSGEISYWDLLVNTEGISIKQNANSAGSFGIGKNAPFAYSGLSMVFYNTLAKDGGRAFAGVTHLVTTQKEYKGAMRNTYDSGKYLYLEDEYTGRPILPEDKCALAEVSEFQRKDTGTDVAVFGFKTEIYDNWEEDVGVAVLKNFVLAIKEGKLEVEVENLTKDKDGYSISKQNLEELLYTKFKDKESLKWTRQIYETVRNIDPRIVEIAEPGDLGIYVRYDEGYSAALSRFRSTGMLINTTTSGSLPHYSVVVVANDVGDLKLSKTLREAEPPQHTEWSAKNITDNRELKNLAAKYIRAITKAVKRVLDEFEHVDITERTDAGIGRYLPADSEEMSGEGADGLRADVNIREISSYKGRVFYTDQYENASSSEGSEMQGSGIKAGRKKRKKRQKNRIPVVIPNENGVKGVSAGAGEVKMPSYSLSEHRTFHIASNKYRMFIKASKAYDNVYVQFSAGRDDDKQDIVRIKNVKVEGMPLMEVHGEKAGPFPIKEGGNNLYIEFENDEIMAVIPTFTMEVVSDAKPSN